MIIHFDGACAPKNPGGYAAWGFQADDEEGHVVRRFGYIGNDPAVTNNLAEWTALIEALTWCAENNVTEADIFGDSQLVIRQASGTWECRDNMMRFLREKAIDIVKRRNMNAVFNWQRRRFNEADGLSRMGLAIGLKESEDYLPYEAYDVKAGPGVHSISMIPLGCAPVVISWSPTRKAGCSCAYWQEHRGMGMCPHMAALFFAGKLSMKPRMLGNRHGEIIETKQQET